MDIFSDSCLILVTMRLEQSESLSFVQSQLQVNDISALNAGQTKGCNELIISSKHYASRNSMFNFTFALKIVLFFFIIKSEVINTRIFRL